MKDNSFENAIKSYLDERAKTDELFAKSYTKSNKNLKECCNFILGEAKKRGSAVAISDAEVFGMAVHYYSKYIVIRSQGLFVIDIQLVSISTC